MTKCAKCGIGTFRLGEISPSGSNYKYLAIECSGCGTAIGVADYYNTGAQLKLQEKSFVALGKRLDDIESTLSAVLDQLRRR